MKPTVFEIHDRLRVFPPAQGVYILYRRLIEQGFVPTWLWIKDKIVRRTQGFSIPVLSKVAPYVYVGGQHRHKALDRMRELGITAILNLREESDDRSRGLVLDAYLWLAITDDTAPSLEDFSEGVAFIEEQIAQERGVYIHCASGVGRAPTMAAAYFVACGATPDEAWATIRQTRPFIRPTPPQLEVIREFSSSQRNADSAGKSEPTSSGHRSHPETTSKRSRGTSSSAFATSQAEPEDEAPGIDQRHQMAYERIAGDPNLTADLTDSEAQELLNWAQEETQRLVSTTQGMTEKDAWQALDPKLAHLRRYLRRTAKESASAEDTGAVLRQTLEVPDYPDT